MVEEARNFYVRKKPVLILDKRKFQSIKGLNTGDSGQLLITAIKEREKLQMEADGVERITNVLRVIEAKIINNKDYKIIFNKEI